MHMIIFTQVSLPEDGRRSVQSSCNQFSMTYPRHHPRVPNTNSFTGPEFCIRCPSAYSKTGSCLAGGFLGFKLSYGKQFRGHYNLIISHYRQNETISICRSKLLSFVGKPINFNNQNNKHI